MNSYEVIRNAIQQKQPITADYKGYHRVLCPHVIGMKNGREQCLCYQSGGESSSGLSDDPRKNWRCMAIDELSGVAAAAGEPWVTAPNHTRPQTCVGEIDLEVSY